MRARLAFAAAVVAAAIPLFASITGNIIDREGRPIAGARVSIYPVETIDARRVRLLSKTPERTPLATATSDAKGSFKLDSPKELVVELQADAKGYGGELERVERDDEGVTMMLGAAPAKQGTVTANGKPVAGATVVWIVGGGAESLATTDANGRYSVPDPSKSGGRVIVIHPDYALHEEFYGGPRKTDLNQKIEPGVAISGKVVAADGTTPAAGAAIVVEGVTLTKSGDDGTFNIAHASKRWETLEARLGDRVGSRASNSKAPAVKLGPAASLSGVVRDSKTQQPVALAEVRLMHATPGLRFTPDLNAISTLTDAKGAFSFSGIHSGNYELTTIRPGYAVAPAAVAVTAAQRAQKMLTAIPQARISGTVVDEDKRPVAGAIVNATAAGFDGNRGFMNFNFAERRGSGVSGPDGRFVVATTREGDVIVDALKKGFPQAKSPSFKIAAGERKSGMVLTIPRGVAVTGRVTDASGKPLSGVNVIASAAEQGGGGPVGMRRMMINLARSSNDDDNVQTGSDGTFTIRLKEGMYDIGFRREGFAAKSARAVQVNATTKPIEIKLDAGVEITGIVTRGGTPISDVNVGAIGSDQQAFGTSGPDGRFTLGDLTPGSYMVVANKQEDFIQQMKNVTAPATDVKFDLPPGGRVVGHVVDKTTHQPVTSFQAGVSTSRSGGGMMIMTPPMLKSFTSDDGSFTLDNVPAGTQQIVANAPGYTTGKVPSVVVEEGKTTNDIEIGLETGVKLTGRVTGSDGSPLTGVAVRPDSSDRAIRMMMNDTGATTDSNGEYTLDSLESGDKTFSFSRSGYISESRTVSLNSKENRLDVQLSAGMRITGLVVTDAGAPVPDASVRASSAASSGFGRSTRTDASGAFAFDGVAPGHYSFTASKDGFADGIQRDVDISSGAPVRLALGSGGIVTGHVSGVADSDLANVTVYIRSSSGGATSVPVDQGGNFSAQGAPIGTLRVSADIMKGFSDRRTTDVKTVELAAGGSVQVDLEFNSQTTVRGVVTRNGVPLQSAVVQFSPAQSSTTSTSVRTSTDDKGNYTASGLADGTYTVAVIESRLNPYSTTYDVHGSGTFDIPIKSTSLRGRVTDSASGDPVDGATVQLRLKSGGSDSMSMFSERTTTTDANGVFVLDALAAGTYSAVANKDNYGSDKADVTVGDSAPPDVELRLAKIDGVQLKVTDARDGRTLGAQVVVYDLAGQVAWDPGFSIGSTPGTVAIPVPPGQYRAVVSAPGYAAQSLPITSPSSPSIGLTPGGTLLIHSSSSSSSVAIQRGRLVSGGMIYTRPFNRDGSFGIAGATSQVANIQPNQYKLEILGPGGAVIKSVDVTIIEGTVTNVDI